MGVSAQHGLDRMVDIAHVVHGIKHTEHIDAVNHTTLDKLVDHVIGIMPIAQNVLAAKQHLLRRVGHRRFQQAQPFPGVFAQIADTGIKRGAAPRLNRPVTDLIEFCANRQHIFDA